jgi:predicted AAA+ superfamily ATPase
MERKFALRQAYEYVDGIIESEISRVDGVKRDKTRAEKLLKSYARNISTSVRLSEIQKDVLANDIDSFDIETLNKYINALKLLYVIEDQPAWSPNLRSKTAIRTTDTRHFVDPSIAVAALGSNPEGLLNDLNLFGYLFESMCIRDLRIYAEAIDGKVLHYRDKNRLEADAVIQLRDGRYGLVEVKLGNQDRIDESAYNLIKLSQNIDSDKMNTPSFLMVITGGRFAYKREDGVLVIPITNLKD